MSIQMGAEFKMEQNGTLFCLVGALEGGFGGGWSLRGVHPKKYMCLPNKIYPPEITVNLYKLGNHYCGTLCQTVRNGGK